jgi:hypothetical protein
VSAAPKTHRVDVGTASTWCGRALIANVIAGATEACTREYVNGRAVARTGRPPIRITTGAGFDCKRCKVATQGPSAPKKEIERLERFLSERFPGDLGPGGSVVDVAIRLLEGVRR